MNNYIIVIDTNNAKTQIGLFKAGQIIDFIEDNAQNEQSKNLFFLIDILFSKHNIDYQDIEEILVTIGPGSFTGIRVGIAAVNGIKIGSNISILGFTNFQSLAFLALKNYKLTGDFTVIINAYRGQLYMQDFDVNLQEKSDPTIIDINDLQSIDLPIVCEENLQEILNNKLQYKFVKNDLISSDLFISFRDFLILHNIAKPVKPLYIRLPDAKPIKSDLLH